MTDLPCSACISLHGESSDIEPQHLELVGVVTRNGSPIEEHYQCPACGASLSRSVAAVPEARIWFVVDGLRH